MARQTKYGASPLVRHFLEVTEMKIASMIDYRANEKKKAYGTAVKVNANTLRRRPIHA